MDYRKQCANVKDLSSPACLVEVFLAYFPFFKTSEVVLSLIDSNRVFVNDALVTSNILLTTSCTISFITRQSDEPFCQTNYSILYEDDFLLVVNKPPFLVVHPAGKYYFNTLTHLLKHHYSKELFLIHRIDKETSGIIIFAKNKLVANYFRKELLNNRIEKYYLACVHNRLPSTQGSIIKPLLQTEKQLPQGILRDYILAHPQGVNAISNYIELSTNSTYSLIYCKLITGKKHQLRAHLAEVNSPIVGDKLYGAFPELFLESLECSLPREKLLKAVGWDRQLLHAYKVGFNHPNTKQRVTINAPLPEDMLSFIKQEKLLLSKDLNTISL
jgi:23S rRNA pseudouridine1911/1915/1917 synthase